MKALWKAALLATLAVMACVREEEKNVLEPVSQEIPEGYHLVTIKAGKVADDPSTKTTYANDRTFSWTSGDAISVLFNNGSVNQFFTFTTTGTGASATFTGLVADGYNYEGAVGGTKWALFPASASHVYTSDTDIKFYMPEADDGGVCNIPMIAQNASTQYEFHHMCGAIKFTFRGLGANQNVKLSYDAVDGERYASGLFNVQKLAEGVSKAIIRSDYHESGAKRTRNVTTTASAKGVAYIYLPIPMSSSLSDSDTRSTYGADFNFDLNDADTDASILAVHRTSGSFSIDKGRVTVMGAKRVAGSEPLGGIIIDGSFGDWEDHTERYMGNTLGVVKATADRNYLYIYQKFINANLTYDNWHNYQYVYVDTDNDNTSGSTETSQGYGKGAEKRWKFFVYFDDPSAPYYYKPDESKPFANASGSSWVGTTLTGFTPQNMYKAVKGANDLELEYCIPLSALGIVPDASSTKNFAIGIKGSFRDGTNADVSPVTNRLTITIPAPGAPAAAPGDISFTEATEDYDNPERGLYNQTSFYFNGSSIPSLSISSSHLEPLELVLFYLTGYKATYTLPDDVLAAIRTVFDNLRAKGKKAIVRFGYSNDHEEVDKPWDAGITNISHHISQIKPILTDNEDIIYVVQAGFIGTYGEWYYTTSDFNFSVEGGTLTGYANRAQVVTDLLDATPASRQVSLRTPFYKRYYFTEINSTGINAWTAISDLNMDNANKRLSLFNDAFLANNDDDTGTFLSTYDWDMWESQSAYLITGGETAYQSAAPDPAYSGSSVALTRIANEHISYLNKNPENKIMKSWIDGGNLNDIKKALGYRLVATEGSVSYTGTSSGDEVDYSISIRNKGSVRVIYPRPCKLVYIHLGEATTVVDNLGDVRSLLPGAGASTFSGSFNLPVNAEAGDKIAVWMPDSDPLDNDLDQNPAYSIRLANSDISWENGYNVIYTF